MQIKLDSKNNAMYIRFTNSAIVESEEIKNGIIIDYDDNNTVVGIEILDISKHYPDADLENVQIDTV